MSGQVESSVNKNKNWFRDNLASYSESVAGIDSYDRLSRVMNANLEGAGTTLDIGNGGVFDYDVSLASSITAVDLFVDDIDKSHYPEHVTFLQGSALALPIEDATYDTVVIAMLLHHLVGETPQESLENVRACIAECRRVLRPGGKLVLAESCIPPWFYEFEKQIFPLARRVVEATISHPITIQYPVDVLKTSLLQVFGDCEVTHVPKGRFILQFGVKVPSFITPVEMHVFTAS